MIPFHCKVSHHGTSVKVQIIVLFSWRNWLWLLAGSPSISGAVIRTCWLQFYIQFISLLAAYTSLLAAAVLCLMPYALPRCCSVGSANPLYLLLLTPKACLLFLALAAPYMQWFFLCMLGKLVCAFYAGITCLVLHLHAGIACLVLLACDCLFLICAYPRVSVVNLAMIGCYL